MTLKTLARAAAMASAGLMLAACVRISEPDAARVDCGKPGPHGVTCKIQRTAGNGGFEACWDLVISCRNKGGMSGGACHKVAQGQSAASEIMPVQSFSNQASCDVPTSGKVEHLKIKSL
ncbi:hypothetical protein UUA_02091 [Rhodanobacter thiooxydans LCS2]|nr:hypothetical protein UUA_02091 [Rhodanobacter thiooxydans LCS2]